MKRSLLLDFDDYENFTKHPVSAYDPHYTQDIDTWRLCFDEFMHFTRELILSNPTRKTMNFLHGIVADVIYRVKAYERHSGVNLFPTTRSCGSLLHSLYSADTLT